MNLMETVRDTRYDASDSDEQEDLFEFDAKSDYLSMTPDQFNDLKALCDEYGLELDAVKQQRKCYYTALITGERVLRKFKSPDQSGFTIKFKTAAYDPVHRCWYGLVRSLKKPAEYANKAITELLYIIASTSKAGVMYEEDAVDDPRRFEEQYATTQAAIRVNQGALAGGKIMPKGQPVMNTGYDNILAYANNSMTEVSGISKEFMGTSQNKQVAALLESQRINQVLATLATYFDAISLYQLEHARMMITFIRMLAQNSQGRLVKIVGQDGAQQYQQLTEQMMVPEYDIDISEAPTTPAQKEQTTQIMLDFADKMAAMGQNIYHLVIPYLPIKPSDQQKMIKAITPDPEMVQQQQQANAQQAEVTSQLNEAIRQGTIAKAARDMADSHFIQAKTVKTFAETMHEQADTAKVDGEIHNTHADTLNKRAELLQKGLSMVGFGQQPMQSNNNMATPA
jgi:hypothetical protein